ncbi:MAG: FkbM family methyltransferase [Rhizonema sp. PD37]|nr:FkbM family methyltransferase [Rhizonema sp. PD37]
MSNLIMSEIYTNKVASLIYNLLLGTVKLDNHKYISNFWHKTWHKSCSIFSCPINTTIHGHKVVLNYGYTYPINSRQNPSYNNPLVELVYQAYITKKSPITLIDIGAAIGDTVLLVYSNCPNMIQNFYCVDGDKEFFRYLQQNLGHFKEGTLILSMLSQEDKNERELVRTHAGTASAQGEVEISARSLDSVMLEAGLQNVDVLKIDVDGFDGKILLGARYILQQYQPALIFEWHPILCEKTGNSQTEHFEALVACGYEKFIWFNKFGEFSHFMYGFEQESVSRLMELCLRNKFYYDWHYDVVALHHNSIINPVVLAELSFAKARKSKF